MSCEPRYEKNSLDNKNVWQENVFPGRFLLLIFGGSGWPRIEMFGGFNAIVTNLGLNVMHCY